MGRLRRLACLALLGLAGCGMQPMELPTTDPQGPGLFTGEQGAFVLTRPMPGAKPADTAPSGSD
jgi:hypothetical protein